MSEEQLKPSVSAAKAARRAAIAVAPLPPVETVAETPQAVMEAAEEVMAETVETVEPVMEAAMEAVMEAVPEPVIEPVLEPVMEPAMEAAAEMVEETVEALVEAAAPEPVMAATVEAAAPVTASMFKLFEMAKPNMTLFEQSARNVQALADAGTTVAKGAQEASKAWMDAAKSGAAMQREGMKQIAAARSVASLVSAYSDITKRNMETFVDCTQKMTRMSLATAETAGKMLRAAA